MAKGNYAKANADFKKDFDKFRKDYELDAFEAIRILSKQIEEIAHEERNVQLFE